MKFLKKNPLFAAFFVLILGPTIILSVLSFQNIFNDALIAQKNFETRQQEFQQKLESVVYKEEDKIFQDTKFASQTLYEQPANYKDFSEVTHFRAIRGVKATFLFHGDSLIYPQFPRLFENREGEFSSMPATFLEEQRRIPRSFRLLRSRFGPPEFWLQTHLDQLTFAYKAKNYDEALRLLNILEHAPAPGGYLEANLSASLRHLHFDILAQRQEYFAAEEYALETLRAFLLGEFFGDIASIQFLFNDITEQIKCFEYPKSSHSEEIEHATENLNRELFFTRLFLENKERIFRLLEEEAPSNEGILFMEYGNETLFRMSYPWLAGSQVVVGILDDAIYRERILNTIESEVREWKDIPYSIRTYSDSLLVQNIKDDEPIESMKEIGRGVRFQLFLHKKNQQELKSESRRRVLQTVSLIAFSLLTVVVGLFFMLRFIQQERSLLSMKANFLSSISHELKTPITSIKMAAEMMACGKMKSERIPSYGEMIGKASLRLENLIDAILNYTRMENGRASFHWERLNLTRTAQIVYDSTETIAKERGLLIDKHFETDLFIMGDHTAIYSLMQNLIENAIKYTNPPGNVHVRIYSEENHAVFEVEDDGIGIPPDQQKNIFNDFYRVGDEMTRSTKGSGLGLAIVKRAADAHHAVIAIASRPGEGSTFTIKFKKAE